MEREEVGRIASITYKVAQQHLSGWCCIETVGILLDILETAGVKAYPLTVRPRVYNPPYAKWRRAAHISPNRKIKPRKNMVEVLVGGGEGDNGWPAHLVVIAPELVEGRTMMFDLTIEQANRPEFGIILRPLILAVPKKFIEGKEIVLQDIGDCLVAYKAYPRDKSFERCGNWHPCIERDIAVQAAVTQLYG